VCRIVSSWPGSSVTPSRLIFRPSTLFNHVRDQRA
jgi:hypothetical protein